uniref:Uncharacterized protein n=1 Tax=Corethron hystrix TaxID=216773 RepID=A0A7S1BBZ2_9STRA
MDRLLPMAKIFPKVPGRGLFYFSTFRPSLVIGDDLVVGLLAILSHMFIPRCGPSLVIGDDLVVGLLAILSHMFIPRCGKSIKQSAHGKQDAKMQTFYNTLK